MKALIILMLGMLAFAPMQANTVSEGDPDPKEILRKAEENLRGSSSKGQMKMTIIRPTWTREMTMKFWNKGEDYSLILVTAPSRDKGTAFLKRNSEMWNWQPSIDRVVKMPPSMMSQSWMGSDFSNDDLVRQTSIVNDYDHKLLGKEKVGSLECYKIELIPHEEAAQVWGKVIMWVDVKDYLELKTEFYDEDDYLVNTVEAKNIKEIEGHKIPLKMIVTPAEDEGNQTIIEYLEMSFKVDSKEQFFSVQNMKRVR